MTVHINVCEHPEPVAEMRRIHQTISQTLGYRTLEQPSGNDVWQLKVILHALGYFRPGEVELGRDADASRYTPETVEAVERFRADAGLSTAERGGSPPGLVDRATVDLLWAKLEEAGEARRVRERLQETVQIRR